MVQQFCVNESARNSDKRHDLPALLAFCSSRIRTNHTLKEICYRYPLEAGLKGAPRATRNLESFICNGFYTVSIYLQALKPFTPGSITLHIDKQHEMTNIQEVKSAILFKVYARKSASFLARDTPCKNAYCIGFV